MERSFGIFGFYNKLMEIKTADIVPGASVKSKKIISLRPLVGGLTNIEGLATYATPNGNTAITMISDDNFKPIQKTVLFTVIDVRDNIRR